MSDQEESNEPRKRIPVAVSSQETPFKDTEYTYNVDAARAYGNPRGAAVSPISPVPQYAHEVTSGGDSLAAYRQSPYPYTTNKDYYQNVSGWAGTYQDDGSIDYGLSYSSYPIVNQEPTSPVVSGYPAATSYNERKPVFIQPAETTSSSYSYGSLTHRPAAVTGSNNDAQGFSLSSMAASLPRRPSRLYSSINRTLTSPSTSNYRTDGLPTTYQNIKTDVAYSTLQPSYEPPYSTTTATTATTTTPAFASDITTHRAATITHAMSSTYPSASTAAAHHQQQLYTSASDPSIRSEDPNVGLSYVYSNADHNPHHHRNKHSSGSLLSNGHVYVPDPNHTTYAVPTTVSSRKIEAAAAAPSSSGSGSGSVSGSSTTSGSQCHHEDAHRRSAGSLRGD
ncbi:hypothetical protein FHL15_005750 [Xylaria flabelliformis]|uniref:Uncharacterized protein n=1 Tax=Xylaria flabelliformis TaxID=2512241 RepID=A0A553HZX1_9PEZI|nr:hypothetical protein FHL15_005750 [Xylaria flabelliformis]